METSPSTLAVATASLLLGMAVLMLALAAQHWRERAADAAPAGSMAGDRVAWVQPLSLAALLLAWALLVVLPAAPQPGRQTAVHDLLLGTWLALLLACVLRFAGIARSRTLWLALVAMPLPPLAGLLLPDAPALLRAAWLLALAAMAAGVLALSALAGTRPAEGSVPAGGAIGELRQATALAALAVCAAGWSAWNGGPALAMAAWPWLWMLARVLVRRPFEASAALHAMNRSFVQQLQQQASAHHRELRQALDEARHARDQALAADAAKSRVLAAAGHDLRQPVHALGLYLGQLAQGPLDPGQHELAVRMRQTLDALHALHAPLTEVAALDAEAVQPRWQQIALAPLLRRLADEYALSAEARGLRLVLHVARGAERAADEALHTVTDPALLERLLRNLLANAVKYTDRGGVLLACRCRDGDLRIEIWDSGIGIAAAAQERVFEAFEQLGAEQGRRRAGSGLGLAIARRLARVLQLRLALHSRPGHGTVFLLEGLVPRQRVPPGAGAVETARADR